MRSPSRVHPEEPGSEELVFSPKLLGLLAEEIDLGGERLTAGDALAPAVVGESDPSGVVE
jgi:hypothetical protein